MNKIKDESLIKKVNKAIIASASYDEMKFLDDWIAYTKQKNVELSCIYELRDKSNTLSSDFSLDDSSSFESVMNFYMDSDSIYANSEENDYIDLYLNSSSIDHDYSTIDLVDKANIVDSAIIDKINDESSILKETQPEILNLRLIKDKPEEKTEKELLYKVNTTVVSSIIYVNKIDKDCFGRNTAGNSKNNNITSINNEFSSSRNAECQSMNENKNGDENVPLRKFIISTEDVVVNMDDIFKLSELRNKILIGQVHKRTTKGYYNQNWIALRLNFFTCYGSKPIRLSSGTEIDYKNGDIICPNNPEFFFKRKYTVDLLKSRLYLCKKQGHIGFFTCYSEFIPAETDLIDITDLTIQNIIETQFGYKAFLVKDEMPFNVLLNCLNFAIRTDDGYRFFKVDTVSDFLKWIVAFKFRMGQIDLDIGE